MTLQLFLRERLRYNAKTIEQKGQKAPLASMRPRRTIDRPIARSLWGQGEMVIRVLAASAEVGQAGGTARVRGPQRANKIGAPHSFWTSMLSIKHVPHQAPFGTHPMRCTRYTH